MKKIIFLTIAPICMYCLMLSCKKKSDSTPTSTTSSTSSTPLSINSPYQASFTLDGTKISYVFGTANFDTNYGAGGSIGTSGSPTNRYFTASVGETSGIGLTITKGTLVVATGGYPSNTAFSTFFPVGTVPFAPAATTPNGIVVSYWDGTTKWSTDLGTADQTGSNFKIEASSFNAGVDYTAKTYLTFNCKLYDGSGNMKTLTNGVLIGNFANL